MAAFFVVIVASVISAATSAPYNNTPDPDPIPTTDPKKESRCNVVQLIETMYQRLCKGGVGTPNVPKMLPLLERGGGSALLLNRCILMYISLLLLMYIEDDMERRRNKFN